jgi:4-hydroxyphenylpyruvate dioxygenase
MAMVRSCTEANAITGPLLFDDPSGSVPLIHHIHFHVPDAEASQDWFCRAIGMKLVRRLERDDRITYLLRYRHTWFLLSSPTTSHSPIARYLQAHAPGVADVALEVEDLSAVLGRAAGHHHRSSPDPPEDLRQLDELLESSSGARWGRVRGWGSVRHTLMQRSPSGHPRPAQRSVIDHVVLNVPAGDLEAAASRYEHLFGFERQQNFRIRTARSGLRSQVLRTRCGELYFNINEPACERSQIQDFITVNRGAGIQHLAFRCEPLLETVKQLRRQGFPLLPAAPAYYQRLRQRLDQTAAPALCEQEFQALSQSQILMDWQPEGPPSLLLQIFSLPIFADALFFLEFIERRGTRAEGFGEGNFLALYEAVEAELQSRLQSR